MPVPDSEAEERLDAWRRLAAEDAAPLLVAADVVVTDGTTPAAIARLRRDFPGAPVAEALELVAARRRAATKFPGSADLLADRLGVEQATSSLVAAWKARRFGDRAVLDLCCGIGGDSMALAARGPCVGVDRDPVRALMAARNAGIATRVDDVAATPLDAPLLHLDPARRDERSGRRSWRLDDLAPGVEVIERLVSAVDGAAVKLGPGLPLPPPRWHERQSVSVIAEHRRLVQAVVWTGSLAGGLECEAVDLPSGDTFEGGAADWSTVAETANGPFGDVLVECHPAIERLRLGPAVLRAALGRDADRFGEPAPGLGLVTGPTGPLEDAVSVRWLRTIRIHAVLAGRLDRVADEVSSLSARTGAGRVVVRTRAGAIDADAWTRRLGPMVAEGEASSVAIEVGGWRLGRRVVVTIGTSTA